MHNPTFTRAAAICGLIGPLVFGCAVAALTFAEYDFMRSLGWDPVRALDWPSALALGPYGGVMTLTFLVSGLAMTTFAVGLRRSLSASVPGNVGTGLLALAGLALAGLVFSTDPTLRTTPATWHGILHDSSFAVLGLTLLPAMVLLGAAFRREPRWRDLSLYTFVTVAVMVPTFWLKGAAFYIFFAATLTWGEVAALRLLRLAGQGA